MEAATMLHWGGTAGNGWRYNSGSRGLRCTALMTADRLPVESTKSYTAWLQEDNEELVRT